MEIKGIKYIAPCFNNSGYAKASRGNILALHKLGVPLTVKPISFEKAMPDLGEDGRIIRGLVNKDIDYNIVLIHSTPEFWSSHKEDGKFFVGYTIWETTKLHPKWICYINDVADLCMVGCEWNVSVFKDSGIKVKVVNIPHIFNPSILGSTKPYNIYGIEEDTFVFFSVFQFTERKNPLATIKSYWQAFPNNEKVALVFKTYRSDYSEKEKNAIRTTIMRLKKVCPAKNHPPIHLVLNMLTEEEMSGLYMSGDCYVSLDRGEGFGLGPFQAGANGKPIIVTGFGGVTEYAKHDNSYLVDYVEVPVFGMPYSPWYLLEQNWAEASQSHGSSLMKHVFNNRDEAYTKGRNLQKFIFDNFNEKVIGNRIINAIRSV
jgi:glycosyltransferase involved in cell wall biosynthesis